MSDPTQTTSKELVDAIRERHELNWTGAEHMQTQAEIDRRDLLKEISRLQRAADEPPAARSECQYCKSQVDSQGGIYHESGCDGLKDVRMNRLQYDALIARTASAQPPPDDVPALKAMREARSACQHGGAMHQALSKGIEALESRPAQPPGDGRNMTPLELKALRLLHDERETLREAVRLLDKYSPCTDPETKAFLAGMRCNGRIGPDEYCEKHRGHPGPCGFTPTKRDG